jgi:uncharacterized membrane protein YcaP (DUF421 family)
MATKVVTIVRLIAVTLLSLSLAFAAAGRIEFSATRGFEYIIALLMLDAAHYAAQRGDNTFSVAAFLCSAILAALTLI